MDRQGEAAAVANGGSAAAVRDTGPTVVPTGEQEAEPEGSEGIGPLTLGLGLRRLAERLTI